MLIKGTTRILGIFGDPVSHSLSPVMQNEALQQAGVDAVYVPFHVTPERLPEAVAAIRNLDILGVNITIPHKETVCSFLDEIDEDAQLIGAVNTVVNRDGRLHGYNTDGTGFLASLEQDLNFKPFGKRVLLLGAGGACRAALVSLARAGASWIGVANRTPARSNAMVTEIGVSFPGTTFAAFSLAKEELKSVAGNIDLLVNTSSVGLKGESFEDFPWEALNRGADVYDMVYTKGITPLLQTASDRGHSTADGLGMLAAQGEEGFKLWTGGDAPSGVMKDRLLNFSRGD